MSKKDKSEFTSVELADCSIDTLSTKSALLKKELFNLRFQKTLGDLNNTSRFSIVRKYIARINTEINKRNRFRSTI